MAVTAVITHVLQKTENYQIYQEIGVYYNGMFFLQKKKKSLIKSFSFKCFFYVLEEPWCEGKNRKISLSLYIRLELLFYS